MEQELLVLKSRAYDLIAQRQYIEQMLHEVNLLISKKQTEIEQTTNKHNTKE